MTSPLFHLPVRMGGLGVGSAVQRRAAAPWTALQTVIPTLMAATNSPDMGVPVCCHTYSARSASPPPKHTRTPNEHIRPPLQTFGRSAPHTWHPKKHWSAPSSAPPIYQLMDIHVYSPIQKAILISQTARNTGARLQQPNSEAYEAETDAFRSHWRGDTCLHIQLRVIQPTSHPRAQTSVQPSEFAPFPSMSTSSTA